MPGQRIAVSEQLSDYLEVAGYAAAARWVYGQAIEPGTWTDGGIVSLTEVREVHRLALEPAWEVAPHPDATRGRGLGASGSTTSRHPPVG